MTVRKMEHIGIMVTDLERSRRFYCDVMGLEEKCTATTEDGEALLFLGFQGADETLIELVESSEGLPEVGLVHHLAFTVDDVQEEISRLNAAGVSFIDDAPKELPNGTKYCFFYGPDNEHLELFQPARR